MTGPLAVRIRPLPFLIFTQPRGDIRKAFASFTGILQARCLFLVMLHSTTRGGSRSDDRSRMLEPWAGETFRSCKADKAPIAIEVVRRMDELFEIERTINGKTPEQRVAVRQEKSKSLVLA